MKSSMILAAMGSLVLAQPLASLAIETTTFAIDTDTSYVSAYVFNGWINDGSTWDDSGVYWRADWVLSNFQLGGSFTVETVTSGSDPEWKHLYLVDDGVTTDAPGYTDFSLPYFFSKWGEAVSYASHPCFDTGFYAPPGQHWSCSGGEMGKTRTDEGTLTNGVLETAGAIQDTSNPWGPGSYSIVLPYGESPVSGLPIDYSYVNGLYAYHMVAVAQVPEPESALLILAGLGLVGYAARRRQKAT